MPGSRETSEALQTLAAKVLTQKTASRDARSLAASALTQAHGVGEHTSERMASLAGRVLQDRSATAAARRLAGSVLSQAQD
ncbi:hypothetical protein [Rhodocista pekingensis]|uniref:ANTAR domain-containing protein n=1 Tax=Rhodocista pekingensis TaxID=201185 RepID=A0ABW2KT28_9PROT